LNHCRVFIIVVVKVNSVNRLGFGGGWRVDFFSGGWRVDFFRRGCDFHRFCGSDYR
jgi:hypothetical protein